MTDGSDFGMEFGVRMADAPAVAEACWDTCADFGDPPCWRVEPDCRPCDDCLRAAGVVLPVAPDPAAVVGPLL